MPDYRIEFHPNSIDEAVSAQHWYAERSKAASIAFVDELSHAVSKITEAPLRWPKYHSGTRRYIFPRYPFSLVYRIKFNQIEVIAIMHHRRKPGYWVKRK